MDKAIKGGRGAAVAFLGLLALAGCAQDGTVDPKVAAAVTAGVADVCAVDAAVPAGIDPRVDGAVAAVGVACKAVK